MYDLGEKPYSANLDDHGAQSGSYELAERPDVVLQGFAFVQKNKFGVYHIGKHNCQNNGNTLAISLCRPAWRRKKKLAKFTTVVQPPKNM